MSASITLCDNPATTRVNDTEYDHDRNEQASQPHREAEKQTGEVYNGTDVNTEMLALTSSTTLIY